MTATPPKSLRDEIHGRLQASQDEGDIVTKIVVLYEIYDVDAGQKGIFYMHGDGSDGYLAPWDVTAILDWVADDIKYRSRS